MQKVKQENKNVMQDESKTKSQEFKKCNSKTPSPKN
jgi:hypothetical protein